MSRAKAEPASEPRLKAAKTTSSRFVKGIAVGGDQGDDARNLHECRNKLEYTCDKVVIACDQVGEMIATAQQTGDDGALLALLPMLQSLWELRWELFISPGEVSAEPAMRRNVACYPEEEAEAAQ